MRHFNASPLLCAVVLWACSEAPDRSLTDPSPRVAPVVVTSPCDASVGAAIAAQQVALFHPADLASFQASWATVVANCPTNLAQAREDMLTYVARTIEKTKAGNINAAPYATPAEAMVAHWDYVFPYVDYLAPQLPALVFGPEGALRVIKQGSLSRELTTETAAMTVPVQLSTGDQRGHLFVIYQLPDGCLGGTNLAASGPCFEFAAFPGVAPEFDPKVKVGICQPVNENDELPQITPALGHLTGGFVRIPAQEQYPTFCSHLDEVADAGSWRGGFRGIATRLAYITRKAIGVEPLYAVHGGLGGLGKGLSPFRGVDLTVFLASLSGQTIGFAPTSDAGTWSQTLRNPGTITVQESFAGYQDTVIVLNQGGGACEACSGLILKANFFDATNGTGAVNGTYEVSWVSTQDKSAVKGAPFVLRAADGLEIARVTYVTTKTNRNAIHFNGVEVGSWARQTPQTFLVRVNLDTKRTALLINGVQVASNVAFVQNALSLASLAAEFVGIDSGVMGWAEISVQRTIDG